MRPATVVDLFTDPDRTQAQCLLEAELVPAKAIRAAYFAPRSDEVDLCGVLVERHEISSETGEEIRRRAEAFLAANPELRAAAGPRIVCGVPDADYRGGEVEPAVADADATISISSLSGALSDRRSMRGDRERGEQDLATRARLKMVESYKTMRTASPLFAPHADLVFEHVRQIGIGGMGIIHQVVDRRLGRDAALKLIRHDRASDLEVWRFMREARIMARLDHPSIPPVYESGTDSAGQHYMLMRVVKGIPFDECIRRYHRGGRSPRELAEYLQILVKVGEALAYAHHDGIVHRDVKPNNIMVGSFGEAMVLDWGLARDKNAEDQKEAEAGRPADAEPGTHLVEEPEGREITQIGAVMGTVGYMPPEQARGEVVDERADVFALGAVLSKLLTNQTPFDGHGTLERLRSSQENRVRLPIERDPKVPGELNAIAAAALAPNPQFRTPSAEAFVQDLKAYLSGNDVSVYRYRIWETLLRKVKRNPVPLIASVILTVFTGVIVQLITVTRAAREQAVLRRAAEDESRKARAAELRAITAANEARENANKALAAQTAADRAAAEARKARDTALQDRRKALLEKQRAAAEAARSARLRAEAEKRNADRNLARLFAEKADRVLVRHDLLRAEAFLAKSLSLLPTNWSARRRYLEVRLAGSRLLWTSPSRERWNVMLARPGIGAGPPVIIAAGATGRVEVWSLRDGRQLQRLPGHGAEVLALAPAPDGERLAVGDVRGRLHIWSLTTGLELAELGNGSELEVRHLAFLDDGVRLVAGGLESALNERDEPIKRPFLTLWDTGSRRELKRFSGIPAPITELKTLNADSWATLAREAVQVWRADQAAALVRHDLPAPATALAATSPSTFPSTPPSTGAGAPPARLFTADRAGLVTVLELTPEAAIAPVTSFTTGTTGTTGAGPALADLELLPGDAAADRGALALLTVRADGGLQRWDLDPEARRAPPRPSRTWPTRGDRLKGIAIVDSDTVVSIGAEGHARVRELSTDTVRLRSSGHDSGVRSVAFAPDGARFASSDDRGGVFVRDTAGRRVRHVLPGHDGVVRALAFGPRGELLATGCDDRRVRLFKVESGEPVATWQDHTQGLTALAFSPDGRLLASASAAEAVADVKILIQEVKTGAVVASLTHHSSAVLTLSFDRKGQVLASAGKDRKVRLWDLQNRRELYALEGHSEDIRGVAFGPEGLVLASASLDQTVRLWNATTGAELGVLKSPGPLNGLAFSPDGAFLATAGEDLALRLWDVAERRELMRLSGHDAGLTSVAWSADGHTLLTGSLDATVKLWESRNLRLTGHRGAVLDACFSPDGEEVATAGTDRTLRFWSARTGEQRDLIAGRRVKVGRVRYSPSGDIVAWANGGNTVRFAKRRDRAEIPTLKGHDDMVTGLAFSPDGRRLASAGLDRTARLWRVDLGSETLSKDPIRLDGHERPVGGVAYSPDGRLVVTAGWDATLRVWDAARGEPLGILRGHTDAVTGVAVADDGSGGLLVASSSDDTTVRLWRWRDGESEELRRFRAHEGPVKYVDLTADGELVASAGDDGSVRLFSVAAGVEIVKLNGHGEGGVTSVRFGRCNGRMELASAGRDGVVRLWNVEMIPENVRATLETDQDKRALSAERLLERAHERTGYRVRGLDLVPIPRNHLEPGDGRGR